MVDVLEEKWDAKNNTLSGKSRVVRNDPYELRIAAASPKADWTATSASVSNKEAKIEIGKQEKGLIRATISALANGEVAWSVKFTSENSDKPVAFGD
jgi:hypothetical protein